MRDERIYTVFNILGLIANFTVCALFAYFRAKISYQTNRKEEKPKYFTSSAVQILYQIMTGLIVISSLFMADALRRIVRSLHENPFLKANNQVLWLHIIMILMSTIVVSISAFFVFRAYSEPGDDSVQEEQAISRIILFTSLFIVQVIMIYLFTRF